MKINPLKGGQEILCMKVDKVYDWIINEAKFTLTLGDTSFLFPGLPAGVDLTGATISCEVQPDPFIPFRIVSREDKKVLIDSEEVTLQAVTIEKNFLVTLNLTLSDGTSFRSEGTGMQFLYVSNFLDNNMEIYNIDSPTSPINLGEFGLGELSVPTLLAISNNLLYVPNAGSNTVTIYDLLNPTSPQFVTQFGLGELDEPTGVAITDNTLYVVNNNSNTVQIYDITNPTVPLNLGDFGLGELNQPIGIAITGTTLYVGNLGDDVVRIYDISVPNSPVLAGVFGLPELNNPSGMIVNGNLLYVSNGGADTIQIYDITNPTIPNNLGSFGLGELNNPIGMTITGNILYVANGGVNFNIEIYDISNPVSPSRITEFGTGEVTPYGLAVFIDSVPQEFSRFEQVLLCAPEETNIDITYTQQSCFVVSTGTLTDSPNGGQVTFSDLIVEVIICQNIQSTYPVTVEFDAVFCQPRDILPSPCPSPVRPPQCPIIFPDFPPAT